MLTPVVAEVPEGETLTLHRGGVFLFLGTQLAGTSPDAHGPHLGHSGSLCLCGSGSQKREVPRCRTLSSPAVDSWTACGS